MAQYVASDFIDKFLVTSKDATAWLSAPGSTAYPSFVIPSGTQTQPVYAIVHNGDDLWFEIMDDETANFHGAPSGTPFFVKYSDGQFDAATMVQQGLQTTQQKADAVADADKNPVVKYTEKWGGYLLLAGVGTAIAVAAIKSRKQKSNG